jgi:tRNA (cmo5U34)-methyltransferase
MTEFNDSRWSDGSFSKGYRDSADDFIPERRKLVEMTQFLLRYFRDRRTGNSVLDLGCGDGLFVHELFNCNPDLEATLVDASDDMLAVARLRLAGHSTARFVKASFQELLADDPLDETFDFILSSLAIHHLHPDQKEALFGYVFSHLNPGGFFLIIDVVSAPTEALEDLYLTLWKEWIMGNCDPSKRTELLTVPRKYRENPDNRPDTLMFQLRALERIGFKDVDCYYKFGIFAIFGGVRDI